MIVPDRSVGSVIHEGPWWRHRGVLLLNLYLLIPLLTSCANGYDSSLANGLQILPAWQHTFGHPSGRTLGIITSAQMIGSLAALPFTPLCADRFGRRVTLVIGAVLVLAGVGLQAVASTVGHFIGTRMLVGAGLIFGTNAAPLLITELAYPTQRGKATSLYNTGWYGGSIVAAWTCLVAYNRAPSPNSPWSWRVPVLGQALGPLLQIFLIWFVPESPRWLISKGRDGKASRILARFHAVGFDERDPLVLYEVAQIREALKMEKKINKRASFSTLFSTPGNRKRMRIILGIACFSQWSGNGLVSYYINLVLEDVGVKSVRAKATINGCLQIWNLAAALTGALLVDRVGRRTLFIISNAGMLIAFSVWALTSSLYHTSPMPGAAKATIPFIFLFYLFYGLAYTPMLVTYTLEILPFSIRAKGFAMMNLAVSIALAFSQFVDPWALDAISWKFYLVYCGWLGFELVFVILFVVETRGRTLEETAALFDGEEKPGDVARMKEEVIVISISRHQTRDDDQNEDYAYPPGKPRVVESYELELQRPHLVLERDLVGYYKSRDGMVARSTQLGCNSCLYT
ncbi:general substrate transporter [Lactifluus subvellereus]|nr:general substrate transporter [Lactifluus subvellereus]